MSQGESRRRLNARTRASSAHSWSLHSSSCSHAAAVWLQPRARPDPASRGERPAHLTAPLCARPASPLAVPPRGRPASARRAARFCRGERPAHLTVPPCAQPASAEARAQRASRCTRMPRGDRGPWRARGSCVKIRCAYKRCRSQRCVKSVGREARAARTDVNADLCRYLHPAAKVVRVCGRVRRKLCSARTPEARGATGSSRPPAVQRPLLHPRPSGGPLGSRPDPPAARLRRARRLRAPGPRGVAAAH